MILRFILPALAALAVFVPSHSQAVEYPWCAQYGAAGGGGRNCGFSTLQQCQATVSGVGGFCERNSFYAGPYDTGVDRPARKWRPHSQN
jgi:hypothetical protein